MTEELIQEIEAVMALYPSEGGRMLVNIRESARRGNEKASEILKRLDLE